MDRPSRRGMRYEPAQQPPSNSMEPDTNSPQRISAESLTDEPNSASSSLSDLSVSNTPSLSTGRTRRPRPKPINLGQIKILPTGTAQNATLDVGRQNNGGNGNNQNSNHLGYRGNEVQDQGNTADVIAQQYQLDLKESDLENLEELGMGSGGTVYRVRHRVSNTVMAKKIIHQVDAKTSNEIIRELQILNKCHSPHIISFYGAYATQGELCICMEFMDVGSLEKISKVAGRLPEKILAIITTAVLKGLVYLYDNFRIIHRDIKPSNILVNSQGKVKLCDFGVSKVLENSIANTFVGTGAYMSPERIEGTKYSTQCDSWSLALTLIELATGKYPFRSNTDEDGESFQLSIFELLQHIISEPVPSLPRPYEPGGGEFTNEFCDYIQVSLAKDPAKRPTPSQLLSHPFIIMSQTYQLDLAAWARTFLDPNLDEMQMRRWSKTQDIKRKSLSIAKERGSGGSGLKLPAGSSPSSSNNMLEKLCEDMNEVSVTRQLQPPPVQRPLPTLNIPPRRKK